MDAFSEVLEGLAGELCLVSSDRFNADAEVLQRFIEQGAVDGG